MDGSSRRMASAVAERSAAGVIHRASRRRQARRDQLELGVHAHRPRADVREMPFEVQATLSHRRQAIMKYLTHMQDMPGSPRGARLWY